MKIIRQGHFELPKNAPLLFECNTCGCLCIADDTEYYKRSDGLTPAIYKCPCCSNYIKECADQEKMFRMAVKNNLLPK